MSPLLWWRPLVNAVLICAPTIAVVSLIVMVIQRGVGSCGGAA